MALSTGKVRTTHHSLAACKRPKYITDVTRCENMDEKRFSFQIQRSVKTKKKQFWTETKSQIRPHRPLPEDGNEEKRTSLIRIGSI